MQVLFSIVMALVTLGTLSPFMSTGITGLLSLRCPCFEICRWLYRPRHAGGSAWHEFALCVFRSAVM